MTLFSVVVIISPFGRMQTGKKTPLSALKQLFPLLWFYFFLLLVAFPKPVFLKKCHLYSFQPPNVHNVFIMLLMFLFKS